MKQNLVAINLAFILLTAVITCVSVAKCQAQYGEFEQSKNGLIYADSTVAQLKHIVDSLNLKFKVCELNKTYRSKLQGKAHFVSLEAGNMQQAKMDMDANMSFQDFLKKYPKATSEKTC